jgi:2-polyprenyl-3-methyl-5-hydroxy-6-metoxy-1,4-benzoquinol methylase
MTPPPATKAMIDDVRRAMDTLLADPTSNAWFRDIYWCENEARVQRMLLDVCRRFPDRPTTKVLDVGCYSGYISFLFGHIGYQVTATDALDMPASAGLLTQVKAEFFRSNFDDPAAFNAVPDATFDVVLLGEVIEHVLNHPLGLMQQLARVTRPGGLLILTTPNPATFLNAMRLLGGKATAWGAQKFMELPKLDASGKFISHEGIHYHEYFLNELVWVLEKSGYSLDEHCYMPFGVSQQQQPWKRWLKQSPVGKWLTSQRWFGSTHYLLARKAKG